MGGTGVDVGFSIAVDALGNVYTTGSFQGTVDFDPGVGTFNLTGGGCFISKLDGSGNFVWAQQMGGTIGYSIAVDVSGNVYTTGYFGGTADFDPGGGTYNLTSAGFSDIFVSKLDASGNFVWARAMGGVGNDESYSIIIDVSGNVYTTGYFQSTADFDPGAGTFNLTPAGFSDIFVSKLDASGNFVWAKGMGGTLYDEGHSITTDATGNVYTAGRFSGIGDFDPGVPTFNLISAGNFDIFISKLDASGNFVWAKSIGGPNDDRGYSVTIDTSSNVYTTGEFQDTVDFDPGVGTFYLSAGQNIFISKLDSSGNFIWAKAMGSGFGGIGYSIAIDASNNVYSTGIFGLIADFDPGVGTFNLTSAGAIDIFISKLDASGNFVWAVALGGTSSDISNSIALDASSNVYTAGLFYLTADFDPGVGVFNLASGGGQDIFVHKMSQSPLLVQELSEGSGFAIFPNPSSGIFNIESKLTAAELAIYNVLGKVVFQSSIVNHQSSIDLSAQPNGIYFVRVQTNEGVFGEKIIIQK